MFDRSYIFLGSDYANFLKKATVQMHSDRYQELQKVDVEMAPLDLDDAPPPSPGESHKVNFESNQIRCSSLR